jgi:glycosyltransferase involved in cell wall biosynthesis
MATYNGGRYVRRQLETILPQLEGGDEVVISDDGSTDDTVAIVESLHDPRIRLLTGHAFRDPIRNFEHSLRHARGDVVVLSDQDDVWLDNKLPLVRELFAGEGRRPFLVVLDAHVVDEDDRSVVHPSVLEKLKAGPGILRNLWTNRYLGCCMAFSSDLLDAALPFPPRIPMHDMWLGQLCERIGTTRFVPVATMRYRRHAGNVTGFEIRFEPVAQVARRVNLALALLRRVLRARYVTSPR